jgi:hypothetical protein
MTIASSVLTTADINGGTIDGTVIGGSTPAAISGTTGQFGTSLNVDGTITSDGLTVDGNADISGFAAIGDGFISGLTASTLNYQAQDHTFKNAANNKSFLTIDGGTGDISFYEDTGTTPKFFWDASAERLGIGVSNPSQRFQVDDDPLSAFSQGFTSELGVQTSSRDSTATRTHYAFRNPNGQVGAITTSASATTYATSSDYRLKEDVQPMVGSVDRLMALKPVNFAWKADGSRVDGFLAHEAQEVVPECVTGSKDAVDKDGKPEYQGIDQSKLVPLLTAALQEALQKIEALEARVAALEA